MMDFSENFLKIRDVLAFICLFLIYHGYEGLCYFLSNTFAYYQAVPLFALAVFAGSLGLIYLHDFFRQKFSWDALGLQYLNSLREEETIPPYRIFKRLIRFILRHGYWVIFVLGPIVLGPFVITVLLRKSQTWKTNLTYAWCGACFNALFWVALMKGLGVFTWRYV